MCKYFTEKKNKNSLADRCRFKKQVSLQRMWESKSRQRKQIVIIAGWGKLIMGTI